MSEPITFSDILKLWPRPTDLARDTGFPASRIYQWLNRNFVHPKHWPALIDAARRTHEVELTPDQLMQAAVTEATRRRRARAARKAAVTRRANRERQHDAEAA